LPFVLVSWGLLALAQSLQLSALPLDPAGWLPVEPVEVSLSVASQFLCSLGGIYLVPQIGSGTLVLLALALTSWRLLVLAGLSWSLSAASLYLLGLPLLAPAYALAGTQAVLGSLMVCLWLAPSLPSLGLALAAGQLSCFLYLALQHWLLPWQQPVLAIPFLAATWWALDIQKSAWQGFWTYQHLIRPTLPESAQEEQQLAVARGVDSASVALCPPFRGSWEVYQGFAGPFTHQEQWVHSLDFVQQRGGQSFSGHGLHLTDYFCYGQEILAPCTGVVIACQSQCLDNPIGEVNLDQPWGNYLMIETPQGPVVVLAHLATGSLRLGYGDRVQLGQVIALCGNSGRSPQPHLHVHVQKGTQLGDPSIPWHLCHVLVDHQYQLRSRPGVGERLTAAQAEPPLQHLPVGRQLTFRWRNQLRTFVVELDLQGQFWLVSDLGARVAFWETHHLLAFFRRCHRRDACLDALVLALGLTPHARVESWTDRPASRLLPGWHWSTNTTWSYGRSWDAQLGRWIQSGSGGGWSSRALFSPDHGLLEFSLQGPRGHSQRALLEQVGQQRDEGIPGWKWALAG
jgi:murein DD-endopeptidase MepM/ murein hydrolase activator NlpD/urea transporter